MSEIKITDLVPQETIDSLRNLDAQLKELVDTYVNTARELAKGLQIKVNVIGDIDKIYTILVGKSKEAAATTEQMNNVMAKQQQVSANTTNTIARQLMEQEKVNKTQREAYTDTEKFKSLLEQVNGSYEARVKRLVEVENELAAAKDREKELNREFEKGAIDQKHYTEIMTELRVETRALAQQKADLNTHLKNEEREMNSVEDSYRNMSQRLELLKKAYKDLTSEERQSPLGKEMEGAIQNLDMHLKDLGADMGEHQRNVGNYAIACKDGAVTVESLNAVIAQEARTTQDLADQTKILEQAKMMLNQEDANYQTTLEALNNKLEENKRKLTDVSDILGKEATSVAEAEAQNKRLIEAIKYVDLTSTDAQKHIKELNDKVEANTRLIKENTPAMQDQAKAAKEQARAAQEQAKAAEEQKKANEGFTETLMGMLGVNVKLGSSFETLGSKGSFIDGLHVKTKAFAQTLMGLLANPWVLAFLGITGIAMGFKWWYDYNKGLEEASRLTENFTGATGAAADKVTAGFDTLAGKMEKGYSETIGAANTLVQQFGISWEEARQLMQDGITAGADYSGNLLANIERFAPALRDAGMSADEFMAMLAETRNGIFNERGIQDILKGGTRLRAMTKGIEEALNSAGISAKQMQKDLEDGNITMLEAVQQVAGKLKELPENSQAAGLIMKQVFGRTAAEGGTLLIQSIADINTNLEKAKESMGELGRLNEEQMEAQRELNEAVMALFKMSGTSFEQMTLSAKTYVTKGLTSIIKGCMSIANWFIRMYNEAAVFRVGVVAIGNSFKVLWNIAKFVLQYIVDYFKAIGKMLEGIVTMNWDKFQQGFLDSITKLGEGGKTLITDIGRDLKEAWEKIMTPPEIKKLKLGYGEVEDIPGPDRDETEKKKPDPIKTGGDKEAAKAAKEAEKRAKEELKRLNELEEAKIAVMEQSHEKEILLIRLKFKKKLSEIKGESETEVALRLQLAAQCEKEVADCELKYQQQLAKINFANRLASVKKGSREELTLKLAQIEAERDAELKAAKANGADITLIHAKFNRQREELENEYALKRIEIIQKEYAAQQSIRDNAMMKEQQDLAARYAKDLELAGTNEVKRTKLKEDYENKIAEITEQYAIRSAKASVEMIEKCLEADNLSVEERAKLERELMEARINMEKAATDAAIAQTERKVKADTDAHEKMKKNVSQWLQVAADALNAVNDLTSAVYDAKITKIEEAQEANTEAAEKEQNRIAELVEKQVISQEEGEARKRAAAAQTERKNEELEKKKAAIQYKQAVWDKANSVAQAGIATALAIVQALPNVVLAAIAGAMGAAQIATILATPIPKYAKGTDHHKGGPAIVGDGGRREIVLFRDSAWLTPDKPTLMDIPAGAMVLPSVNCLNGDMAQRIIVRTPESRSHPYNDIHIRRGVSELATLLRRMSRQQHADAEAARYEIFKNSKI